jgi:hypothetical protein
MDPDILAPWQGYGGLSRNHAILQLPKSQHVG